MIVSQKSYFNLWSFNVVIPAVMILDVSAIERCPTKLTLHCRRRWCRRSSNRRRRWSTVRWMWWQNCTWRSQTECVMCSFKIMVLGAFMSFTWWSWGKCSPTRSFTTHTFIQSHYRMWWNQLFNLGESNEYLNIMNE